MKAMVISTGSEILKGEVINSNAAWIGEQLSESGVEVLRHVSVGDELEPIAFVLSECAGACDMVVVTGGLGPTKDDLTAEAAASMAGVPLKEDLQAAASVDAYFEGREVAAPASNKKQSMLPQGSTCIPNPVGTAPAFTMAHGATRFWFLPGVPREMKYLMREVILKEIQGDQYLNRRITTFGLPESVVGERLADLSSLYPGIHVGYRANFPVIEAKVWAYSSGDAALESAFFGACIEAERRLGEYVISKEGLSMAEAVAKELSASHQTLAVAESCTGGLIGSLLTDVAGSSDWFLLSAVTYANSAKMAVLGVREEIIEAFGAVSEETAGQMAEGARRVSGADIGLATSGIAGPSGGSDEKPVGTLCIGLATKAGTKTFRIVSPFKERHQNKRIFAFKALDLLRRSML